MYPGYSNALTKLIPSTPIVTITKEMDIITPIIYEIIIVLLYLLGVVRLFLGIIKIVISGSRLILNIFNADGIIPSVFSFNSGKKLLKSVCWYNANIFIINNPMFNKSSNKQDLDITFIPLLALYITSAINSEQLIIMEFYIVIGII